MLRTVTRALAAACMGGKGVARCGSSCSRQHVGREGGGEGRGRSGWPNHRVGEEKLPAGIRGVYLFGECTKVHYPFPVPPQRP